MKLLFRFLRSSCLGIPAAAFALSLSPVAVSGAEESKAPARIELTDQNDKAHVISFPARQITVLCMADRKGREEANRWAPALAAYKERAAIHGIADAAGTPGFMKERIRKRIQAGHKHDLLIDWTGAVCTALGCQPSVANLVILSRDGTVLHRTTGAATAENVNAFNRAMDRALERAK